MYHLKTLGLGGCHTPIVILAKMYLPVQSVLDITNSKFEDILFFLIQGYPVWVITNVTFSNLPSSEFETWHTPDGPIQLTYKEHSVLMTGYDENYIYFNDPLGGKQKVGKKGFQEAWEQMGRQAITYVK